MYMYNRTIAASLDLQTSPSAPAQLSSPESRIYIYIYTISLSLYIVRAGANRSPSAVPQFMRAAVFPVRYQAVIITHVSAKTARSVSTVEHWFIGALPLHNHN